MMSRTWILAIMASSALAGGCNLILGLEEAKLRDGGDDGGSGGSSGSGGGGSGGGSSSGGSSPGGPVVRYADGTCGADVLLDEETIQGCVYRISCDPLAPTFSISECVSYGEQERTAFEMCAWRATSCEQVADCLGRVEIPSEGCVDDSWSCIDGDIAFNCTSSSFPYAIDCSFYGGFCLAPTSETGSYAFAGCVPDDEPTCPGGPSDGTRQCSGNVLYSCIDGVARGVDCARLDSICIEDTPGAARCTNITQSCASPDAVCSGDDVEYCFNNGYGATYSCQPGTRCEDAPGQNLAACVSEGCALDDPCREQCQGSTLQICRGGSAVLVDCTQLGFTGCSTAPDESYAYCSGYEYEAWQ